MQYIYRSNRDNVSNVFYMYVVQMYSIIFWLRLRMRLLIILQLSYEIVWKFTNVSAGKGYNWCQVSSSVFFSV